MRLTRQALQSVDPGGFGKADKLVLKKDSAQAATAEHSSAALPPQSCFDRAGDWFAGAVGSPPSQLVFVGEGPFMITRL